jgi:hypothetical protein
VADFDNILVFVKVAQFESITRAPRSRGMPITTASRRLSVLESELGVSPLRHTTRRVTLTAPGREYFSQCQRHAHPTAAEVGVLAGSRFRALLESKVPALAIECLPGGAGSLEASVVDQGMNR